MRNKEELLTRIDLLFSVLIFSSEKTAIFKTAERICINQERGSLFDQINVLNGEMLKSNARFYQLPSHIEKKVDTCIQLMSRIDWKPTSVDPENMLN